MLWPKQSLLKEGSRRLLGAAVWLVGLDLLFAEMASAGWAAGEGLISMLVCEGEGPAGRGLAVGRLLSTWTWRVAERGDVPYLAYMAFMKLGCLLESNRH